ncbi:hypothetical protein JHV675_54300 [Mycobacterium avium subsp. hominissuis]
MLTSAETRSPAPSHSTGTGATETRSLALPGHAFTVVALDGNPVPNRAPAPGAGRRTAGNPR